MKKKISKKEGPPRYANLRMQNMIRNNVSNGRRLRRVAPVLRQHSPEPVREDSVATHIPRNNNSVNNHSVSRGRSVTGSRSYRIPVISDNFFAELTGILYRSTHDLNNPWNEEDLRPWQGNWGWGFVLRQSILSMMSELLEFLTDNDVVNVDNLLDEPDILRAFERRLEMHPNEALQPIGEMMGQITQILDRSENRRIHRYLRDYTEALEGLEELVSIVIDLNDYNNNLNRSTGNGYYDYQHVMPNVQWTIVDFDEEEEEDDNNDDSDDNDDEDDDEQSDIETDVQDD